MKIVIEINTDNDAFVGSNESARIINRAVNRINDGETEGRLIDINGNTAGMFSVI